MGAVCRRVWVFLPLMLITSLMMADDSVLECVVKCVSECKCSARNVAEELGVDGG